eukprot:CAMPEP_0172483886 /NCGR_PEP_ID=MMETSP1066-20121228/11094_1 /TAXON_ID=671091 /ORGANISM="Coscinodiscus wailesii, Strain CCMP2513" /LENGTH=263 /DNA_ID=CAMNT_0013248055 /DNA_START=161 /DNA_END=953 /DNA_ORIENTATION=-
MLSTRTSANAYPTFLQAICHGDKFGISLRLEITILNNISTFQYFLTIPFISHYKIDTKATQKNDVPYKRTAAMLNIPAPPSSPKSGDALDAHSAAASEDFASPKYDNTSAPNDNSNDKPFNQTDNNGPTTNNSNSITPPPTLRNEVNIMISTDAARKNDVPYEHTVDMRSISAPPSFPMSSDVLDTCSAVASDEPASKKHNNISKTNDNSNNKPSIQTDNIDSMIKDFNSVTPPPSPQGDKVNILLSSITTDNTLNVIPPVSF